MPVAPFSTSTILISSNLPVSVMENTLEIQKLETRIQKSLKKAKKTLKCWRDNPTLFSQTAEFDHLRENITKIRGRILVSIDLQSGHNQTLLIKKIWPDFETNVKEEQKHKRDTFNRHAKEGKALRAIMDLSPGLLVGASPCWTCET